jgi:hypothetical protein
MYFGGDKYDEVAFQCVKKFMNFSEEAKIDFLRMKFQRDSGAIHSTYSSIVELRKSLEEIDKLADASHFAHVERILGIETEKWNQLVAERRENERIFGALFSGLYGVCESHNANMWFVWDSPNAKPVCVGCDREKLELHWEKQRMERK